MQTGQRFTADIWEAAFVAVSDLQMKHVSGGSWDAIAAINAVAAVILAERERCARVAEAADLGSTELNAATTLRRRYGALYAAAIRGDQP